MYIANIWIRYFDGQLIIFDGQNITIGWVVGIFRPLDSTTVNGVDVICTPDEPDSMIENYSVNIWRDSGGFLGW